MQGTISPDGYFTIGLSLPKKQKREDKEYERDLAQYFDSYYQTGDYRRPGCEVAFRYYSKDVLPARLSRPVGLSSPPNFNRPSRYGLKGISSSAKRTIRSAVAVLESIYDKSMLGFLTLTVPELPLAARQCLNQNWSKVTNHLMTVLRRELKKQSGLDYLVGVTEVQEKRWQSSRCLYYHFHICFISHFGDFRYFISPSKIRLIWMRCLNSQIPDSHKLTPQMVKATEQLKVIKKSATRYIAKYCTKGCDIIQTLLAEGIDESEIPRQWWLCSRSLSCLVRQGTKQLSHLFMSLATRLVNAIGTNPFFSWLRKVEISVENRLTTVGVIGYVSPRFRRAFLSCMDIDKAIECVLDSA